MTDIDNLRLLAAARASDDPMGAYALDGCADEIERLRGALVRIQDLTQHNMGMSERDETCVWHETTKALKGG